MASNQKQETTGLVEKFKTKLIHEKTGLVILLTNLVSIILALFFDYSISTLVWLYFIESIVIGGFFFLTMIIPEKGDETKEILIRIFGAFFFAGHYGIFHITYFFFLLMLPYFKLDPSDYFFLLTGSMLLFVGHAFSFYENKIKIYLESVQAERKTISDLSDLSNAFKGGNNFQDPYSRVLPLHITIILSMFVFILFQPQGLENKTLVVLFMSLKTLADLSAHNKKHNF